MNAKKSLLPHWWGWKRAKNNNINFRFAPVLLCIGCNCMFSKPYTLPVSFGVIIQNTVIFPSQFLAWKLILHTVKPWSLVFYGHIETWKNQNVPFISGLNLATHSAPSQSPSWSPRVPWHEIRDNFPWGIHILWKPLGFFFFLRDAFQLHCTAKTTITQGF